MMLCEQDSKIIHKDAVEIVAKRVQPFFLDKNNDNYVSERACDVAAQ